MSRSVPVVPTYRALTIVGAVLKKDEHGNMRHALTITTTLNEEVAVVYEVVAKPLRHKLEGTSR